MERCHCECNEAIQPFEMRLPRTLRVLAMTGNSSIYISMSIFRSALNIYKGHSQLVLLLFGRYAFDHSAASITIKMFFGNGMDAFFAGGRMIG
ncbi:MAG: hypothetical protein C4560_13625 [Nitrospiraceae bacterium]|nr:MAG: hypothetical protein C4560_13625 [Nitrospiraceae bacterium]